MLPWPKSITYPKEKIVLFNGFRSSWENGYAEENTSTAYFSEELVDRTSRVETEEAKDPLQLLEQEFPGFAVESLADILRANGGDLSLTIEMLIQLEVCALLYA